MLVPHEQVGWHLHGESGRLCPGRARAPGAAPAVFSPNLHMLLLADGVERPGGVWRTFRERPRIWTRWPTGDALPELLHGPTPCAPV